jgi:hypothetical protein
MLATRIPHYFDQQTLPTMNTLCYVIVEESLEDLLAEGLAREQEYVATLERTLQERLMNEIIVEKETTIPNLVQVNFNLGRYRPKPFDSCMNKFTLK